MQRHHHLHTLHSLGHPSGELLAASTMIGGRGAIAEAVLDVAAVTAADHVVDVGCGPGVAARAAARRGASVVGIDPSHAVRRLARLLTRGRSTAAPEFRNGTASDLGLPAGSATVVIAMSSAHHWPDVDTGLRAAHRVLAPGGRLVIWEHIADGRGLLGRHGFTRPQLDELAARVPDFGFTEVDVQLHRVRRRAYMSIRATATAAD
jgi:ubiquinone/menaquinone biosynthesis C-methylase UbiE